MNSQRCLKSPVPSFSGEFLCWLGSQLPLELGALCILSETLTWALEDRRAVNIVWKTEAWKSGAAKSSDLEFCHIGDELREFINTEKSGWEYLPLAGANSRFWLEHLDIEVVQVVVSTQYSWCLCSGEQFDPSSDSQTESLYSRHQSEGKKNIPILFLWKWFPAMGIGEISNPHG